MKERGSAEPGAPARFLIVSGGASLYALPLEHVVETMRPLPVEPLGGLPEFVLGVSVIRGAPVPVVDAARLLGGAPAAARRFISLRLGPSRGAALAVEGVIGVRELSPGLLGELPPLLRGAAAEALASVARLDEQLLLVLRGARLVPEAAWRALERAGEAA